MWGQWWPHPLHTSQQWCLISYADSANSQTWSPSFTPVSSVVSMQPSGPLPGSTLLIQCFSTQPLPASEDSCLRQGCPGLIPEEVWHGRHSGPQSLQRWRRSWFEGWASMFRWLPLLVPTETEASGWGMGLQWQPLPPCVLLNKDALLLWSPRLLPQLFQL